MADMADRSKRPLKRTEVLCLDAIRYSADMAGLGYKNLQSVLLALSQAQHDHPDGSKDDRPPPELIVSAPMFAWTVIDSAYRLRCLMASAPRVASQSVELVRFREATEDVEVLRHEIQHLHEKLAPMATQDRTVMGTLTWIARLEPSEPWNYSFILSAGSPFTRKMNLVNPVGRKVMEPIDLVTLTTTKAVDLGGLVGAVDSVTSWVEGEIKARTLAFPEKGVGIFGGVKVFPGDGTRRVGGL